MLHLSRPRDCPTLEQLRALAPAQEGGAAPGAYHMFWEHGMLYSTAMVTENTQPEKKLVVLEKKLVVLQMLRAFLLKLAHELPVCGHLGAGKTKA